MTLADPITTSPATRWPPPADFDVPPAEPLRMTEDEYLAWVDESGRTEWVAGEVVFKMPISELHDLLLRAISASLEALVRRRNLGHVRGEKWATRLPQRPSWREADIIFVAVDSPSQLLKNKLIGPPEVAIELVSPGSRNTDYRIKFAEYEAAGVREYWIVDTQAYTVDGYRLVDARYVPIAFDAEGKIRSGVVEGWWLDPAILFRDAGPPDAIELAQLLGVI